VEDVSVNRLRRKAIRKLNKQLEALGRKLRILHDQEYHYREHLWSKGLDESDTADISDDALDALSAADTWILSANLELDKAAK
jgi:hypothetical protein